MPVIDIHHPHSLDKQRCRRAVDAIAHELSARYKLGDMVWNGDRIGFAGHGVEGSLTVTDSEAHVQVCLGSLYGLLRPVIEVEIRNQLRRHLG
ncbi:MAG TPA: polyhydroxyalkanoic acid system family protein [Rhodanobacteraceae bacterium]|nr:polyhydroxyalkanoic acid system family protein [Rhodanobacteraceae bacterium]